MLCFRVVLWDNKVGGKMATKIMSTKFCSAAPKKVRKNIESVKVREGIVKQIVKVYFEASL